MPHPARTRRRSPTIVSATILVGALAAFVGMLPGGGRALNSSDATAPPTTACGESVPCIVAMPTLPYLDPGTGRIGLAVHGPRGVMSFHMESWAAVRGTCQEELVVPDLGGPQRDRNDYRVAFDHELGDDIDCNLQVASELMTLRIRFDLDVVTEAALDNDCDGGRRSRCSSGSEWFRFEPNAVFTGPIVASFGADQWEEIIGFAFPDGAKALTSD